MQMEVEGPEVRAPSGLFAPIRPFETETMGGLLGKVVFASHHRPEVIHRPMEAKGEKIFAGNVVKIVKTGRGVELLC
ncbi:MAG: hypothetical protein ACTS41_01745 [Candidatus Hodgkinia cicadicola]